MNVSSNRLIIVSNRLPIVITQDSEGTSQVREGAGGLVTALAPVLKNRGGIWIGWPGTTEGENGNFQKTLTEKTKSFGYEMKSVIITREEKEKYYEGFANEIIWPLFHDMTAHCNFNPEYWQVYQQVNRKFADVVRQNHRGNDFVWIHDYHLMNMATELRRAGIQSELAFFLHIPFPPLDIFVRLPWRFQILHALLEFDLIGFQTLRDRRNFSHCVKRLIPGVRVYGRGQVQGIRIGEREIRIGAFPISIDYHEFSRLAAMREVSEKAWFIHEDLEGQVIILGIDRLDYTKGIPERLKAYRYALNNYPELQQKVTFVQVVVPSRRILPRYAALKTEIERLVGDINGQFTRSGWVPIHYLFRSLDRVELLAYYRTSEVALLTPLKDGMNLVAKEYCTCKLEENGVLILSEFAGAAAQLQKYAVLVNPHDTEGIAQAVYTAFRMETEERKYRMRRLRQITRKYDIFWWVDSFLKAAFARDLHDFPRMEDYIPSENDN